MTTFLLWNVQQKLLDGHIVRLVEQHKIDVLLLIEHPKPDDTLFRQLKSIGPFDRVPTHDRFGVFVNFSSALMTRIPSPVANERVDYWNINLSSKNALLLALVHGLDIRNNSEEKRSEFFERMAQDLLLIESNLGHKNTVVVGDFNAKNARIALDHLPILFKLNLKARVKNG